MVTKGKSNKCDFIKVMTPAFRLSYPALAAPKMGPDDTGEEKYSIRCLVPKDGDEKSSAMMDAIRKACKDAATQFWGDTIPKGIKRPIKDGDDGDKDQEKGYWVFNARSSYKPGVVDQKCRELNDDEIENQLYAGCWCRATLLVGATDRAGNKCVFFILSNVQKLRDDTAFGNRRRASDDFDQVEFSEVEAEFDEASEEDTF